MIRKNISKLLVKSERINIDDNSKIVFLSDVHRGDGGGTDTLLKNKNIYRAALSYYYKQGYTLVEVGDGDELWKNRDFRDIAYEYKDVFGILDRFNNDGRLFMIYGNHDSIKGKKKFKATQKKKLKKYGKNYGDEFIYLIDNIDFKESLVLNYTPLDKEIFILHGHQFDFMNNELMGISKFLVRYFWSVLEGLCGFKEPTSPANNHKKGNKIDEEISEWAMKNEKMVIAGHTHRVKFPKVSEGLYFNDGSCVYNLGITTIEINRGVIALVKWSIEFTEENTLYIKRGIIEGPERLSDYLRYTK